jgi:hypothetical protein
MRKEYTLILVVGLFLTTVLLKANNIVVQNVTTTGNNAANKTIQVQFDLSWDNSWRDAINYDAAWLFIKFKDANGLWQHALLNTTGFANGTGTANTLQVTADQIGAWVYRSALGTGTFNSTSMQLQWNYGQSGLTGVTGLEIRLFAIEMVYIPEGEFNVAKAFNNSTTTSNSGLVYRNFNAPGNNHPVINTRLSPTLSYNDGTNTATIRIKGDAGIDADNNGTVDNTTYPIGYRAFYCYKYELSEQQYADFLNTLTSAQITTLGVAGTGITLNNGQYFSSTPNKACGNSTAIRLLAYADWSGVRPMTLLEFNKVSYGPLQPVYYLNNCYLSYYILSGYPAWGSASAGGCNYASNGATLANVGSFATATSTRVQAGASYYGVLDLTGNAHEPVVKMNYFTFQNSNGNGVLASNGNADVSNWNSTTMTMYIDMICNGYNSPLHPSCLQVFLATKYGFRYVRSVE